MVTDVCHAEWSVESIPQPDHGRMPYHSGPGITGSLVWVSPVVRSCRSLCNRPFHPDRHTPPNFWEVCVCLHRLSCICDWLALIIYKRLGNCVGTSPFCDPSCSSARPLSSAVHLRRRQSSVAMEMRFRTGADLPASDVPVTGPSDLLCGGRGGGPCEGCSLHNCREK